MKSKRCGECKVDPAELVCFTTQNDAIESKMAREMLCLIETAVGGCESIRICETAVAGYVRAIWSRCVRAMFAVVVRTVMVVLGWRRASQCRAEPCWGQQLQIVRRIAMVVSRWVTSSQCAESCRGKHLEIARRLTTVG